MLVLTRRSGESIRIGEDIRIRVLSSNGSRVRIGIEAPTDVPIRREKVTDDAPEVSTQGVGRASRTDGGVDARPSVLPSR